MQTTVESRRCAAGRGINDLLTPDEYLESLRDARNVYLYGEKVKDVTTHPAFRNSARSVAHLSARSRSGAARPADGGQ